MDPNATLEIILGAFQENTTTANAEEYARDEAIEALENLTEWLKRGGAMPLVVEYLIRKELKVVDF